MSDVTLLRKLTEKSILKFGKHADVPIKDLLALQEIQYLRWVYYNCSAITFVDEILVLIKIPENARIDKPGKDPQLGQELSDWIFEGLTESFKRKIQNKVKKHNRGKLAQYNKRVKIANSKENLTRKNHGHKK